MTSFKTRPNVVINKKEHLTLMNKHVELVKENYDLYFKIDDQKLKLQHQWNDSIYTVASEIYQTFLLTTNNGDFLLHFTDKQDFLSMKEWLDKIAIHHKDLKSVSFYYPDAKLAFFSQSAVLVQRDNALYFEFGEQKFKLEKFETGKYYKENNDFNYSIQIKNIFSICMLTFDNEDDYCNVVSWLERFTPRSEQEE